MKVTFLSINTINIEVMNWTLSTFLKSITSFGVRSMPPTCFHKFSGAFIIFVRNVWWVRATFFRVWNLLNVDILQLQLGVSHAARDARRVNRLCAAAVGAPATCRGPWTVSHNLDPDDFRPRQRVLCPTLRELKTFSHFGPINKQCEELADNTYFPCTLTGTLPFFPGGQNPLWNSCLINSRLPA